jgi:hypothetical protein
MISVHPGGCSGFAGNTPADIARSMPGLALLQRWRRQASFAGRVVSFWRLVDGNFARPVGRLASEELV